MKCPNCNHENPDNNKFCAECGTKLEVNPSMIECLVCHSQIPTDSKFCPDCGSPITFNTGGGSMKIEKISAIEKLLTLGDFKIGDNIYDVECEDYTKIDDDGWGFKVIKASIDDDGFEYIARVSDKRIFALAIDLAECEDSIPENWKEIGIKDNNILTSFEKLLSRLNFDWEDIDSPGDGISFISSTKWNGENIFIVGSNSHIVISLLDDETKANIYAVIKEDLDDETNESENDDDELPSCPECGSDDVDDDGSDYLQYTCNDCGHNWGHDDTVECPECGSNDVENDGTDNLQYECNDCGHIWGDDDEDELQLSFINKFFPVWGIMLGETTVAEVKRIKYQFEKIEEEPDKDRVICWKNGSQIWKSAGEDVFSSLFTSDSDSRGIPREWKTKYGFNMSLSYNKWISIFEGLGFYIDITIQPRVDTDYGRSHLRAEFVARAPDSTINFELNFMLGNRNGEGVSLNSKNTLSSIQAITPDSTYPYKL